MTDFQKKVLADLIETGTKILAGRHGEFVCPEFCLLVDADANLNLKRGDELLVVFSQKADGLLCYHFVDFESQQWEILEGVEKWDEIAASFWR